MKKILLLTFIITLVSIIKILANGQDSVGVTKINGKFHLRYMVSPGETIYRISTKYKTSLSDLMDINPELEFGLKTGQIINIPYNPEANVAPKPSENAKVVYQTNAQVANDDTLTENGVLHTIQNGETYTSLSKKYNISIDELMKINKVQLKSGQKIIVNELIKAKPTNTITKSPEPKKEEIKKEVSQPEPKAQIPNPTFENKDDQEPDNIPLTPIEYSNQKKKLLIVPFDPYLYFSDADDEIAAGSKMNRVKVRQAFRRRLNALLEPAGYETIHLLGGKAKDSITDLNRVYNSVSYSYQDVLNSPNAQPTSNVNALGKQQKKGVAINIGENSRAALATDAKKYFGVKIRNQDFYTYFNNKYLIDYYVFINQFEVKTNYENCLDRATMNYERGFTIHYSIFDKTGKQIAGNRIYIDYNSNTNQIQKILADNMQRVADKIMSDLPKVD